MCFTTMCLRKCVLQNVFYEKKLCLLPPPVDELFREIFLGHLKKNIVQRNVAEKKILASNWGMKKNSCTEKLPNPPQISNGPSLRRWACPAPNLQTGILWVRDCFSGSCIPINPKLSYYWHYQQWHRQDYCAFRGRYVLRL